MSDAALHAELRSATRAYLAASEPTSVNADGYAGWTPEAWREMATGLGLTGISVEEAAGGLGLGRAVEAIVHEEMGRVLYQGPYFSTVAVALPILRALPASDRPSALIGAIAAGDAVFGVAGPIDPEWPALATAGGGRVHGTIPLVRDADAPDGLLLGASLEGRPTVLLVAADDPGLFREPVETVDLTRPLARARLEGAHPEVLAIGTDATRAVCEAAAHAALAMAAESVGVGTRALDLTVNYVALRHQFGRAIGSFQAVKHECADLLVTLETARSALDLGLAPGTEDSAVAAAIARIQCGRSAWEIAESAVHLHGGIGFTWEHRIHLYFRRAKTNQILLADGMTQHDLIVDALASAGAAPVSA